MVATIDHDKHRMRRSAVANYFSSASIRKREPIIREKMHKLLARIEAAGEAGEVLTLNYMFKAATSDIVTQYLFGKSTDFMDFPDFNMQFMKAIDGIFLLNHNLLHFPWFGPLMQLVPMWLTKKLTPGVFDLQQLQDVRIRD